MNDSPPVSKLGIVLRVGVFIFLEIAGVMLFGPLLMPLGGYLIAAALGTFAAAAIANAVVLRIFERGQLSDIGLGWSQASMRNLGLGSLGGFGAALFVILGPMLGGLAYIERVPEAGPNFSSLIFVSIVLLFGAVGEEMLFRGYGFQVLIAALGPSATILPAGVIFAFAHAGNQNVSILGLVNTGGWGILLGYAFLRSRDLWLPIGLHFGWNWTLPLFGVNLSGFTMGVSGYAVRWKAGVLWSGGDYGPEASILTFLVLILLAYYLWKAPIQKQSAFLLRSLEEV